MFMTQFTEMHNWERILDYS